MDLVVESSKLHFTSTTVQDIEGWQTAVGVGDSIWAEENLPVKVRVKDVSIKESERKNIVELWEGVPDEVDAHFCRQYGRIKDLLKIQVQQKAISALVQWWDPTFRVFRFSDFDLTPTIEEYAELLELPLHGGSRFYCSSNESTPIGKIAQLLGVFPKVVKDAMYIQGGVTGWSSFLFITELRKAKQKGDWERFSSITALLIYGLVLFPSAISRIDLESMKIFGQVFSSKVNPIPAILAETFLGLNNCRRNRYVNLTCSTTLLYVWLCFHMFKDQSSEFYSWRNNRHPLPISRFHLLRVEDYGGNQWTHMFETWNSAKVFWRVPWLAAKKFIVSCGTFGSVPLIGLRGCITYSPLLVMRQFDYTQIIPALTSISNEEHVSVGTGYQIVLRTFIGAWGNVSILDEWKLKMKSDQAVEGYGQWLQAHREMKQVTRAEASSSTKSLRDYESELTAKDRKIKELGQDWLTKCQVKDAEIEILKGRIAELSIEANTQRGKIAEIVEDRSRIQELYHNETNRTADLEEHAEWERQAMGTRLTRTRNSLNITRIELQTTRTELQTARTELQNVQTELQDARTNHQNQMTNERNRYQQLEARRQREANEAINERNSLEAAYTEQIGQLRYDSYWLRRMHERQQRSCQFVSEALMPTVVRLQDIQEQINNLRDSTLGFLPPPVQVLMDECQSLITYLEDVTLPLIQND